MMGIRVAKFLAVSMAVILTTASLAAPLSRPFALPIAAKALEQSKDGKGWLESGVIKVPFVQAEASFKAVLSQSGWRFRNVVTLGRANSQNLYTWHRGGNELTLMLSRIDVNRTAFSWGLSKAGK